MTILEETRNKVVIALDKTKFPKLVTFERKHGKEFYLATSKKDLLDISLDIFKCNNESGYYSEVEGFDTVDEYVEKNTPYVSVNSRSVKLNLQDYKEFQEIANNSLLGDSNPLKEQAKNTIKSVNYSFKEANTEYRYFQDVQETIKTSDSLNAYILLCRHKEYEYEKFEVSNFDSFNRS